MLRDMLLNPNLTAEQRAEIEARIASLSSSLDLYRSLLASLVSGTPKRYSDLSAAEQSSLSHIVESLTSGQRRGPGSGTTVDALTGLSSVAGSGDPLPTQLSSVSWLLPSACRRNC